MHKYKNAVSNNVQDPMSIPPSFLTAFALVRKPRHGKEGCSSLGNHSFGKEVDRQEPDILALYNVLTIAIESKSVRRHNNFFASITIESNSQPIQEQGLIIPSQRSTD